MTKHSYYLNIMSRLLHQTSIVSNLLDEKRDKEIFHLDGLTFTRQPLFYQEPFPRATYFVKSGNGFKCFLKIHSQSSQIEKELRIYNILRKKSYKIRFPLLRMQVTNMQLENGNLCGWLVQEWVDGTHANKEDNRILRNIAQDLSRLHEPIIDIKLLKSVLNEMIPPIPEILRLSHLSNLKTIQEVINMVGRNTIPQFDQELIIGKDLFTDEFISASSHLIHGDFHLNNIIVEKSTRNIIFIDWEDSTISHPAFDLSHLYFFVESEIFSILLEEYLNFASKWMNSFEQNNFYNYIKYASLVWSARFLKWRLNLNKENLDWKNEVEETNKSLRDLFARFE